MRRFCVLFVLLLLVLPACRSLSVDRDAGGDGGPGVDNDGGLDAPSPDLVPEGDVGADDGVGTDMGAPADLVDATGTEVLAEVVDLVPDIPLPSVPTLEWFHELLESGDAAGFADFLESYDGPFCESSVCLFVTCVEGASAVSLRGEFNGWGETPMSPLSMGADCFYHEVAELVVEGSMQYKLFADGEWLRDPLNPYFRFADIALNSALYADGIGRLALVEGVHSPQLDNVRNLYVYVPAARFDDPSARFPVLYMQDGFNLFDNPMAPYGNWGVEKSADLLIAAGAIEPLIIVGIDTDDRVNEYLYTDILLDLGEEYLIVEPKLDLYAQFLVETVKPLVDERFPTKPGRADTGMAGSSFGGISSLYIAWFHADVFGKVASLSGSYWVGETAGTANHLAMRDLLVQKAPTSDQLALRIYLDSGGAAPGDPSPHPYEVDARVYTDWTRNTLIGLGFLNRAEYDDDGNLATPPQNFPVDSLPADVPTLYWSPEPPADYGTWGDYLIPGASLLHLVGNGHAHNEAAWELRFPAVLRFLYEG